ncbi:MAG: YqgE/AlgH family protein [Gammaproteobacteria bacterium]|nr:YqgE/AlgH family protein [Gammaproteobacteria bacterium]
MAICVTLGVALAGASVAGGSLTPTSIVPALPGPIGGKPGPGMFLVAKRSLDDSHFGQSVVYLVEHDDDGTLGLIVNRSSDVSLSEAVPDIEDKQATAHVLYYGGPVGLPMILMLARSESAREGMAHVVGDVYISSDRRVLDEVLAAKKPDSELRFYIGYSGWAAGQLDFELVRGDWHVVAADTDAIFSGETDLLWNRLIERLEPTGIQVDSQPSMPILASAFPITDTQIRNARVVLRPETDAQQIHDNMYYRVKYLII